MYTKNMFHNNFYRDPKAESVLKLTKKQQQIGRQHVKENDHFWSFFHVYIYGTHI